MKKYLVGLCLILSLSAFGGFGGSRGGGSSSRGSSFSSRSTFSGSASRSSVGSSFFGGSRSGYTSRSGSAPITPKSSGSSGSSWFGSSRSAAPSYQGNGPSVVHHYNNDNSFLTTFLWWNLLSQPRQPSVIYAGAPTVSGQPMVAGPVQQPESSSWGTFFAVILWITIIVLLAYLARWIYVTYFKKGSRYDYQ